MGERLNFAGIRVLVVDGDRYSSGIVSQILRGFGIQSFVVADTGEAAQKQLAGHSYDVLITESTLSDMKGSRLVRWVRRHSKESIRQITIILLTGYTHFSNVLAARDSGVNSVVRKPVSPATLYDHIAWSANNDRPFVEADRYFGPCRRFRFGDSAPGLYRRFDDASSDPAISRWSEAQHTEKASS